MPKKIPLDPADAMDKTKFAVFIPEYYDPAGLHPYYRHYNLEPVYQPQAEHGLARSSLSPTQIAEAIDRDVEFEIRDYSQVPQIITIMRAYLRMAQSVEGHDRETDLFLENVRNAVDELKSLRHDIDLVARQEGQIMDVPASDIGSILQKVLGGDNSGG